MKTDLTTAGSYKQSQALAQKSNQKLLPGAGGVDPKLIKATPDYTVELASKNPAAANMPASTPSVPVPSLMTPSLTIPDVPVEPKIPVDDMAEQVTKDKLKEEAKKEIKSEEIKAPEVKEGTLKKPAIFFIKGLDILSSPSNSETGYAGLGRIAESIPGSRLYGWDQKDEMIKEIKKVHRDYPVILVGHSLGGDTAVEVADELDSLNSKFRQVDLLVTIDAIGFNHDIIPQNVKKHLNVFGERSLFLKDGPHVARREEKTHVRNILSPLDHTDIDDDREVQYEIVSQIENTLKDVKA